jgi:hypothetical protein
MLTISAATTSAGLSGDLYNFAAAHTARWGYAPGVSPFSTANFTSPTTSVTPSFLMRRLR